MIRSAISYKKNGGIDTDRLLKSLRCKGDAPMGPGYYGSVYEGIEEKKARMMPQAVTEARNILTHASCNHQVLNIGGRGLSGELDWPELVAELNAIVKDVTSSSDLHPMTRGSQVRTWVFSNGKLSTFGDIWIQALPNITSLEGKRNQIETLPDSFSQLFLETLGLSQNRITSSTLRDSICISGSNLASSLVHLDLSNNQIEYIPESLFEFSRLTSLNLSFNKIKTLEWKQDSDNNKTLALSGCKYLRSLLLNNNAIYHIPLELGLLEQLTNIDLLGNSQREIRVRVLTQSCSKILQYLRERMTPEEVEEARENHREIELALQQEVNHPDNGFLGEDKVQKEVLNDDDDDDERMVCHSNDDSNTSSNDGNRYSNNHEIKSLEKVSKTTITTTINNNDNNDTGRSRGEKERLLVDDNDDELLLLQRISELKQSIADLSSKLENLSMSQAQRTTLKKELAMKRSKLLREQRKKDQKKKDEKDE